MKRFLLALAILISLSGQAARVALLSEAWEEGLSLSTGSRFGCVLDSLGKTDCWGREFHFPKNIRAEAMVALANKVCLLSGETLHCYGPGANESKIPGVERLVQANEELCFLGKDRGIYCGESPKLVHRPQESAQEISVGGWSVCFVNETKSVECHDRMDRLWRHEYSDAFTTLTPQLTGASVVNAGAEFAYAVVGGKLTLWNVGPNHSKGFWETPNDSPWARAQNYAGIRKISSGSYHICAIHDGGLSCEGSLGPAGLPTFDASLLQVAVGYIDAVCALSESGVRCWDADLRRAAGEAPFLPAFLNPPDEFQTEIKTKLFPFALGSLEKALERLSQALYRSRASFVKDIAAEIAKSSAGEKAGKETRLFALELVSPIIESSQTEYMERHVLPLFKNSLPRQYQVVGTDPQRFKPQTRASSELAIRALLSILRTEKTRLSELSFHDSIENMVVDLGRLMAQIPSQPHDRTRSELSRILKSQPKLMAEIISDPNNPAFAGIIRRLERYACD